MNLSIRFGVPFVPSHIAHPEGISSAFPLYIMILPTGIASCNAVILVLIFVIFSLIFFISAVLAVMLVSLTVTLDFNFVISAVFAAMFVAFVEILVLFVAIFVVLVLILSSKPLNSSLKSVFFPPTIGYVMYGCSLQYISFPCTRPLAITEPISASSTNISFVSVVVASSSSSEP